MSFVSSPLLPDPVLLQAGVLTMEYSAGDLRYLHVGNHKTLRRIYVAVRDANWNTIPAQLTLKEVWIDTDAFSIRFYAEHRQDDVDFAWEGALIGTSDSMLTLTMSSIALSTFRRNRIGFCVLHPMSCAGTTSLVEHVDGTTETGIFPVEISPHQPFRISVDGCVLCRDGKLRVLLTNFTSVPQTVELDGLAGQATVRWLDSQTAALATQDPEAFRASSGTPVTVSHGFRLEFAPFSVAKFDFTTIF